MNKSDRFVNVRVKSNAIMLQGMEGSTLGVWVAHGEGRCFWPDDAVKEEALKQNCVALRYVDDDGNVTMEYPMNPNGSEGAVVGLTSPDGRHLCMTHCFPTLPVPFCNHLHAIIPFHCSHLQCFLHPWFSFTESRKSVFSSYHDFSKIL